MRTKSYDTRIGLIYTGRYIKMFDQLFQQQMINDQIIQQHLQDQLFQQQMINDQHERFDEEYRRIEEEIAATRAAIINF